MTAEQRAREIVYEWWISQCGERPSKGTAVDNDLVRLQSEIAAAIDAAEQIGWDKRAAASPALIRELTDKVREEAEARGRKWERVRDREAIAHEQRMVDKLNRAVAERDALLALIRQAKQAHLDADDSPFHEGAVAICEELEHVISQKEVSMVKT
jgi:hypothetical protein